MDRCTWCGSSDGWRLVGMVAVPIQLRAASDGQILASKVGDVSEVFVAKGYCQHCRGLLMTIGEGRLAKVEDERLVWLGQK